MGGCYTCCHRNRTFIDLLDIGARTFAKRLGTLDYSFHIHSIGCPAHTRLAHTSRRMGLVAYGHLGQWLSSDVLADER